MCLCIVCMFGFGWTVVVGLLLVFEFVDCYVTCAGVGLFVFLIL